MSLEIVRLGAGAGPALVRRTSFTDERGAFSRLFAREELAAANGGGEATWKQIVAPDGSKYWWNTKTNAAQVQRPADLS